MQITIQPVEQTLTQSIFSFTHENQDYFMVGDQEVIGVDTQDVSDSDIRWFQSMQLLELAPTLHIAHAIAEVRDEEREDF